MDSLRQSPKPWPAFFTGDRNGANRAAYSLPADTTMLLDRLEENLVFYLVRTLHPRRLQEMCRDEKLLSTNSKDLVSLQLAQMLLLLSLLDSIVVLFR